MSSATDDHQQHREVKTARVRELIRSVRRLTVKLIANEVKMNRETVHSILTEELGMSKICAKMVSRNLTEQLRDELSSAVFDIQMQYGDAAASLFT
jgi:AraC-like DNA-binding protein